MPAPSSRGNRSSRTQAAPTSTASIKPLQTHPNAIRVRNATLAIRPRRAYVIHRRLPPSHPPPTNALFGGLVHPHRVPADPPLVSATPKDGNFPAVSHVGDH